MAQFGAKRPRFAPTATTPDGALPTYNYEAVVTIGKLVAANLTVTNASGEIYGDDGLAEKVDMFASGSLELQTDDKTAEVHAALHGAALDDETDELADARRPYLLQDPHAQRHTRISGRFSASCQRSARQRHRNDEGQLHNLQRGDDHVQRFPG